MWRKKCSRVFKFIIDKCLSENFTFDELFEKESKWMEKILDCETVESTYCSLSNILELDKNEIEHFLRKIDIQEYYNKHPYCDYRSYELLLNKIVSDYKIKIQLDKVCWFHLARTMDINDYSDGIYPLGNYIDDLWRRLYLLVKEKIDQYEWQKFRKKIETDYNNKFAYLYRTKVTGEFHWGPYAMLVRDAAFSSKEIGNHDYLKIPEIVEDISICFEKIYGINLAENYIKNSKSIIVKFISENVKEYYVGVALNYLYSKLHNFRMSLDCNTCYDGKAKIVSKKAILNIEAIGQ